MRKNVTDLQPWECLMKKIVWKQLGEIRDKKILDFGSGIGISTNIIYLPIILIVQYILQLGILLITSSNKVKFDIPRKSIFNSPNSSRVVIIYCVDIWLSRTYSGT